MKTNKYGCKPKEDVCIAHDEPLTCKHGCDESIKHECTTPSDTDKMESWEDRFDKEFPACDCINNIPPHFLNSHENRLWIVNFIRNELQNERQRTIEEVRKALIRGEGYDEEEKFPIEDWEAITLKEVGDILNTLSTRT